MTKLRMHTKALLKDEAVQLVFKAQKHNSMAWIGFTSNLSLIFVVLFQIWALFWTQQHVSGKLPARLRHSSGPERLSIYG